MIYIYIYTLHTHNYILARVLNNTIKKLLSVHIDYGLPKSTILPSLSLTDFLETQVEPPLPELARPPVLPVPNRFLEMLRYWTCEVEAESKYQQFHWLLRDTK